MGIAISVTNQKGGVGKTTTAISLAVGLARQNENTKTLIIDLDSQRNSTGVLLKRLDFDDSETIFPAFEGKSIQSKQIHDTDYERVFMIPSSLKLVEVESLLANSLDGFFRLKEKLSELMNEFDFILFDCPPSLSVITINALVSANYLVVPLQISKFSVDGIQGIVDAVSTIQKRYNPNLKVMGGVLTMYNPRTTLAQAMKPEVEKYIPIFDTAIPQSIIVEEAHLLKKDINEYSPQSKVAKAYANLCKEVVNAIQ